jgi:hypothetical protein
MPRRLWLWGGIAAALFVVLGGFAFFFQEAKPPPPARAELPPGHPPVGAGNEAAPQGALPAEHPPVGGTGDGPEAPPHPRAGSGAARRVVVPTAVEGHWQAVRLQVAPRPAGGEAKTFVVPLGGEAAVPGTKLTVRVLAFLPALQIQGDAITSTSNEPKNPAAQVTIREGKQELYAGWLFARFPEMQAFDHPEVRLTLVEGIPKGGRGAGKI